MTSTRSVLWPVGVCGGGHQTDTVGIRQSTGEYGCRSDGHRDSICVVPVDDDQYWTTDQMDCVTGWTV